MTLPINPDILRAAYDFLAETRPFKRWNLPPGEDIRFRVVKSGDACGWYSGRDNRHVIAVSDKYVFGTESLLMTMAHEMAHLHQSLTGMGITHGPAFKKLAERICKIHGFKKVEF